MKRFFILTILLYLPLFCDELWNKAVKTIEESSNLVPEIIKVEIVMTNMDGEIKNQSQITYKTLVDEKGEVKTEVIQFIRDGKDITKEYKEELKKREEKEKSKRARFSFSADEFDIFSLEKQKNLKIQKKGTEVIDGIEYVLYDFFQKIDEKRNQKGIAYLNSQKGNPYKVVIFQEPPPKYTKEMKTVLIYKEIADGKVLLSQVEMEGLGSFMFFKRRFKVKTYFDGYILFNNKI